MHGQQNVETSCVLLQFALKLHGFEYEPTGAIDETFKCNICSAVLCSVARQDMRSGSLDACVPIKLVIKITV